MAKRTPGGTRTPGWEPLSYKMPVKHAIGVHLRYAKLFK